MKNYFKPAINLMAPWVIVLLFVYLSSGCTQQEDGQDKIFRIAYVMAPGGTSNAGAEKIKTLLEENEALGIKVKLYPNAILGKDRELMEGLRLNSIDMVIGGPSIIGGYAPEYQLLEAPFLFRDYAHLKKVLNGEVGREMEEEMSERFGFHYLGYFLRGPRYLTTTDRIIREPKDLNGLKLRVPELEVYINAWETFGANPTPLPFSDMFMALRQGVVEGQENPLEVIYTNNLYEVQKYVMDTRHLLSFYILAVGDRYYTKFSKEERKAIHQVIEEAVEFHDHQMEKYEKEYREKIEAAGVKFIDVDREPFEKLAGDKLPVLFQGKWKEGLYEKIINTK